VRTKASSRTKLARDSGNEYLSLKVGNAKRRDEDTPDGAPDEWLVGFVEDSAKIGEDAKTHRGIYKPEAVMNSRLFVLAVAVLAVVAFVLFVLAGRSASPAVGHGDFF
jgi:hypothetical protein